MKDPIFMVLQGVVLSTGAATYQILEDRSSSSIKSTLAILHPVPEDFGSYEVTLQSPRSQSQRTLDLTR